MTQTFTSGQILTAAATNSDLAFPTGVIVPYAGSTAPSQGANAWLLCDGAAVSRTTYAALFAVVASTYGPGDGSTTFNVPNSSGRVLMGAGTGAQQGVAGTGVISGGAALSARARGQFGGDERIPNHTHGVPGAQLSTLYTSGGSPLQGWNGPDIGSVPTGNPIAAGGGGDIGGLQGNVPPFLVTNYIIKT